MEGAHSRERMPRVAVGPSGRGGGQKEQEGQGKADSSGGNWRRKHSRKFKGRFTLKCMLEPPPGMGSRKPASEPTSGLIGVSLSTSPPGGHLLGRTSLLMLVLGTVSGYPSPSPTSLSQDLETLLPTPGRPLLISVALFPVPPGLLCTPQLSHHPLRSHVPSYLSHPHSRPFSGAPASSECIPASPQVPKPYLVITPCPEPSSPLPRSLSGCRQASSIPPLHTPATSPWTFPISPFVWSHYLDVHDLAVAPSRF